MSIQRAVADQEEYGWGSGGTFSLRGWKAVDGNERTVIRVMDEQGKELEAEVVFFPRPDVVQAFPEFASMEGELGYLVTVARFKDFLEKHERLDIYLCQGEEKLCLFSKTKEKLTKAYMDASIQYKLDVCTLSGKNIDIRGWAVDALGNNFLEITDECGKPLEIQPQRVIRRDVTEALKLDGGHFSKKPVGFVFSMPREDFCGKSLILTMKNDCTEKKCEISMKEFDFKNSRLGKLKRVLGRGKLSENKKILRAQGVRGFLEYVKDEIRTEDEQYMAWLKKHRATGKELRRQRQKHFPYEPLISIVIPLYNTPQQYLRELLESITSQSYGHFELCLADGSTKKGPGAFVKKFYGQDERIHYQHLKVNQGISGNTNAAIRMARGEFLVFADHDDILEPDALFELVKALNQNPDLDMIYTDEDLTDSETRIFHSPRFKPDFNPDFLRSINYVCHLLMVRRSLAEEAGLIRKECDGAQDYDFLLRCIEKTHRIHHIPKILYHWRAHEGSTAGNQDSKQYAIEAGRLALTEHYARLGYEAEVEYTGIFIMYRVRLKVKGTPKVSVLIPNKDQAETLNTCLSSIYERTDYPNFEILIIENNSENPDTFGYYERLKRKHENLRVVTYEGPFNYSAINNYGAAQAEGEYLLFLNNDTEIISPSWMREMLGFCQREDTGIVGAKLYYPDNLVQHAGVVVGIGNFAGHVQTMRTRYDSGYFGRLKAVQDISAVTAACMMVKRSVFEAVKGFDEEFVVSMNDVDLCLRVREKGLLVVMDPNVELYHYESKSRGFEDTPQKQKRFKGEIIRFRQRWRELLEQGDPYYSPHLTLANGDCTMRKDREIPEIWEKLFPEGENAGDR